MIITPHYTFVFDRSLRIKLIDSRSFFQVGFNLRSHFRRDRSSRVRLPSFNDSLAGGLLLVLNSSWGETLRVGLSPLAGSVSLFLRSFPALEIKRAQVVLPPEPAPFFGFGFIDSAVKTQTVKKSVEKIFINTRNTKRHEISRKQKHLITQ